MRTICRPLLAMALAALALPAWTQEEPGRRPQRTFISPSGEPFRPSPGAPDPFDAWFARVDANHDGAIDRAEFRADAEAFFKVLDTNGDGRIDGFEISAYEHRIAPELIAAAEGGIQQPGESGQPRRGGGRGGGGGGGHGRRGGGYGGEGGRGEVADRGSPESHGGREGRGGRAFLALLNEPEPVSGADFDLDSRVTAAEWRRAADNRFDLLDDKRAGVLIRAALMTRFPTPRKAKR